MKSNLTSHNLYATIKERVTLPVLCPHSPVAFTTHTARLTGPCMDACMYLGIHTGKSLSHNYINMAQYMPDGTLLKL